MKSRLKFYPIIRREFATVEELGNVINRKRSYCKTRLAGRADFTRNERQLIANFIGCDLSEVTK